jgi:hypothetical protein
VLVFTVSGVTNGYFDFAANPGMPVTSFTQQQIANGEVRFVHNGSGAAPSFTIDVSDGTLGDGPYLANIAFTPLAGTIAPPPPAGGGEPGPGAVTPPVVTPTSQALAQAVANPIATNFLRTPFGLPGSEGAQGFVEAMPAGPRVEKTGETQALIAAQATELPTVRAGTGEMIQTQQSTPELNVEPIRAELQVIPTRHDLDLSEEERQRIEVVLNSVRITGLALSVGAVWWAARAAGLVASLLASTPAWRHVDPLPVLGRDEEEEGEWDESAEDKANKDEEHRAAWVLEGESRV